MKRVTIFVNGILTVPGQSNNWNSKAVTHFILRELFAEKLEYFTGVILRSLMQKWRADKLRKKIQRFLIEGWTVDFVAHSNGADVVIDTLRDMDWPKVGSVQLFSPACGDDFDKLGMNKALASGAIQSVTIYIGEKDLPLKLASTWAGKLFGFGKLGGSGPKNAAEDVAGKIKVVREKTFGHSTWFEDAHFEQTMAMVKANS